MTRRYFRTFCAISSATPVLAVTVTRLVRHASATDILIVAGVMTVSGLVWYGVLAGLAAPYFPESEPE